MCLSVSSRLAAAAAAALRRASSASSAGGLPQALTLPPSESGGRTRHNPDSALFPSPDLFPTSVRVGASSAPGVSYTYPFSLRRNQDLHRSYFSFLSRNVHNSFCRPSLEPRPAFSSPSNSPGSLRSPRTANVVIVHVSMSEESPTSGLRLGFIGAGQMAEALAKGWDAAGVVKASSMHVTDVNAERLKLFESMGAHTHESAQQVAEESDVIVIALKPQIVRKVLMEMNSSGCLGSQHTVLSIAAGITISNLHEWAGNAVRVVRVMPNTPCLVGQTAAAMSLGPTATSRDSAIVREMFAAVGKIHAVEEKLLDAVTGLSGSGPAYVFVAIEALADGGVAAGLPRDVALSLAAQTVFGSAKMVLDTGKHPGVLKDAVASPGGTTIAGLHELERGGYRASLMNAVLAATARSKEMSK